MTKLEQAARQALGALVRAEAMYGQPNADIQTALREALDHSSEATDMAVDWDMVKPEAIASDPLYQQGFVDGVEEGRNQVAEQAEQEPMHWVVPDFGFLFPSEDAAQRYLINIESDAKPTPCYAAPVRTKDLTVDEKVALADRLNLNGRIVVIDAVIAAYREKNK